MTQVIVVYIFLLATIRSLDAINYFLVASDVPVDPCPGYEDLYFDKFFDSSNLKVTLLDEEIPTLDGYVTFIQDLNPNDKYFLKLKTLEYKGGRWIDSSFAMNREDICPTFFDQNEIWYDLLKELPTDCPPKLGEKYVFNNKSMIILGKNLPPGMEGLYRIEATFSNTSQGVVFCFILEGKGIRAKNERLGL